jgi:hypothetical protein
MNEPLDMTGPWQAVALDHHGYTIDPNDDEDDLSECERIGVVRRTAAPVAEKPTTVEGITYTYPDRMPPQNEWADVLYLLDDLDDEPDRVPLLLAQAVAVAEALNETHPA